MKIAYFKDYHPNFGDELNPWFWPKLIPNFFDDNDEVLFLGIGSIIGENFFKNFRPTAKKVVFGAGYVPAYSPKSDISSSEWDVYFVRGPRTAQRLNISSDFAIGDSAILLRTVVNVKNKTPDVISFMPHWTSLETGNWEKVCRLAGLNLINPCSPVEKVITELLRSRFIITEAMHGAIVSDALRVPWIPLLPIHKSNREKWYDWSESLGLNLQPYRLWPSSLRELRIALRRRPSLIPYKRFVDPNSFKGLFESGIYHLAAHRLRQLTKISPCLSSDKTIDRATERMLEKVSQLQKNYGA